MAITLRNAKGIPLTHTELDNNFVELDSRINTLENTVDNDNQTLTLVGTQLTISSGNSVNLAPIVPVVPTNISEFNNDSGYINTYQTLSVAGTDLSISNGNTIDLSGLGFLTAEQDTLDTVTDRGSNTTNVLSVGGLTTSGLNLNSNSVALGVDATNVGAYGIAIGRSANTDGYGVAIGYDAAADSYAVSVGYNAGRNNITNDDTYTVAVGAFAAQNNQGSGAIAIGALAGDEGQGDNSVAIGRYAGRLNQHQKSIILNATNTDLNSTAQEAFYVKPIRSGVTANALYYDTTTGEISYGTPGAAASVSLNNLTDSPFTYTFLDPSYELSVAADVVDFGTGNTIDLQNNTVLFDGATIQNFSPSIISTPDSSSLSMVYKSGATETTHFSITSTGTNFPVNTDVNVDTNNFYAREIHGPIGGSLYLGGRTAFAKVNNLAMTSTITYAQTDFEISNNSTLSFGSGSGIDFTNATITGLSVTSYNDSDVDTHLNTSTATGGQVLSWNGSDYDWVAQSGGASYDQSLDTTDDVTFNDITSTGTLTITNLSSVGSGNLAFTSAASVNITATDDINLNADTVDLTGVTTVDFTGTTVTGLPSYNNSGIVYQLGYSAHDAVSIADGDFSVNSVDMIVSLTAGSHAQGVRIDVSGVTTATSTGAGPIYIQRRVNGGSWLTWNAFVVKGAEDHFSHSFVDFYDTGGTGNDISAGDTVEYKLTNGTSNPNFASNFESGVDFELFWGFNFTATEVPLSYSLIQP